MRIPVSRSRPPRDGAAAVEFAIVLPLLMFLFGIGVDFARAFYAHLIITNAARTGALYACDNPTKSTDTAGIQAAALKDTSDLSNVTVTSGTYTSNGINYVWVNVRYPFQSLTSFAGIGSTTTINQVATMRIEPTTPAP
jgi:Flp pilus assembly protein TadG